MRARQGETIVTITETTRRPPVHATTATVTIDLYRDIHKGIRAELFAVTGAAGSVDPADRVARVALAERVTNLTDILVGHAKHEDAHIQPLLEIHLPDLAAKVETDHVELEARMVS